MRAILWFIAVLLATQAYAGPFTITPAGFKGHRTVVSFWRADCAPCLREMNILPGLARSYPALKFVTISVSSLEDTQRTFVHERPENMQLVIVKEDKDMMAAFGDSKNSLPFSAMLHADGSVCKTHEGILGTNLVEQWDKAC